MARRAAWLVRARPRREPDPRAGGQQGIPRLRHKSLRRRPPAAAQERELVIERLGAGGDGIARLEGRSIYVPFTVPGERVRARVVGERAELLEVVEAGPGRAAPLCRHFGECGGCALQHLSADRYAVFKREQIVAALARHGLRDLAVAPLERLPPGTRRRGRVKLGSGRAGFTARASHAIVDMHECAVLDPALVALVARLRGTGLRGEATLTRAATGLDVLLDLADEPDLAGLEKLACFAEDADLARLAWRKQGSAPMPVALRRPVRVTLGGVAVDLPYDAFLQATAEAETVLVREVLDATEGAQRVVDLYAGIGTFALPLAAGSRVHAVEGWPPAVEALSAAARRAGLSSITTERRDLDARPLLPEELSAFEAAVLDPPRAGARTQAAALAASTVERIAAVSCNPATFARDAAILVAGGYRLLRVQPIDQFLWSPHVELVAAFARR